MNCNLRVQADPEIKGEVTSPSWENREKFAASREKCFLTEDTPQKHGYIISSYEPWLICFSYTSISDQTIFCKPLTCLILILFLFFKGAISEEYLKKNKTKKKKQKKIQKELCIYKDLIMATFPCKSTKRRC